MNNLEIILVNEIFNFLIYTDTYFYALVYYS